MEQVRKAEMKDIEQMARLYSKNFPEHIMVHRGLLNNPEYLMKRLQNQDEIWAVKEKDEEILGVAALAMVPPIGLAEVERACVASPFRGNGVAYSICSFLVDQANKHDIGFVEAFARGDQPAMQKTFEKLGFKVYGIAPRFEVVHDDRIVREQFVHMGLELKPESIDEKAMILIPKAREVLEAIRKPKEYFTTDW